MRSNNPKSDINITPLIDIVLVLLIVFIVLFPSLAKVTNAALPILDDRRRADSSTPLVVSLAADGKLFLQQEGVPWADLSERLAPALMLQPVGGRKVFLKVDGALSHGHAVRAMDMIRVGSDLARARTVIQRRDLGGEDGGETKIVMSLRKS